jgi:hypothetical protein
MDPLGAHAAMSAMRRSVLSALPDAPVHEEPQRRASDHTLRRIVARGLYRLAARVEPRPVPAANCG